MAIIIVILLVTTIQSAAKKKSVNKHSYFGCIINSVGVNFVSHYLQLYIFNN